MSQSEKKQQPPDLIEVFKTIANIVKGKRQTARPAAREQQAPARPHGERPARRPEEAAPSRELDFDFSDADFERARSSARRQSPPELDLRRLNEQEGEWHAYRPGPAEAGLSASAGDHRYHRKRLTELRRRLGDPRAVREAFIAKELLDKPIAMRRRKR